MDPQTKHAWRSGGRKSQDIREVRIQRHQHPLAVDREYPDSFVRPPAEPSFDRGYRIESAIPENLRLCRGQILVKQKLHDARTISSLASRAA